MSVSAQSKLEKIFPANKARQTDNGSKINVSIVHSGQLRKLVRLENEYHVAIVRSGTGLKVIINEL
jgi:hypothetical protein